MNEIIEFFRESQIIQTSIHRFNTYIIKTPIQIKFKLVFILMSKFCKHFNGRSYGPLFNETVLSIGNTGSDDHLKEFGSHTYVNTIGHVGDTQWSYPTVRLRDVNTSRFQITIGVLHDLVHFSKLFIYFQCVQIIVSSFHHFIKIINSETNTVHHQVFKYSSRSKHVS